MNSIKYFQSKHKQVSIQILACLVLLVHAYTGQTQTINGISFSAPSTPNLELEMFEELKKTNTEWVGLIPETTLERQTLEFRPDHQNDCWGETIDAIKDAIQLAKQSGLKVFLKPHIVLAEQVNNNDKTNGAKWRGTLSVKKKADWMILEKNYENYILELAGIAESGGVDLFSIGTELKRFVSKRPAFWKSLISKVRDIYHGPLTYSANWDEYHKINFWEDLDFIGVDMYFSISREKTPAVNKTKEKWKSIARRLMKFSEKKKKKILFTEFGYRNINYAGNRPWTHDNGKNLMPNNEAQSNLYEALFQTFWNEPWVAGGFAWKWFAHPKKINDTTFSMQGKPAMSVIQKWYGL